MEVDELQHILDWYMNSTGEGYSWHRSCALGLYKVGLRGIAHWAEHEACGDLKSGERVSKYICDHFGLLPHIDLSIQQKATTYGESITCINDIFKVLEVWKARENGYIKKVKDIIKELADCQDYDVMKIFMEILCDLKWEYKYVCILYESLEEGKTEHHILDTSKHLHQYFTEVYKDGRVDFAIV